MKFAKIFLAGALALTFGASAHAAQWCVNGVCANGVVLEDGAGNKLTAVGGGGSVPTGTAGSPNAGVLSVQGVTNGMNVPVADSTVVSAINAAKLTPPIQTKAQSVVYSDLSSTVITATGNSGPLVLDAGTSLGAAVAVTAASGTNPNLDLILQESFDGGTTFKDIFWCPRFTTTGTCQVPEMLFTGQRQWRYVVSGTSPSFTVSINTTRGNASAPLIRLFYDRSINPNTAATYTATWDVAGCKTGYAFESISGSQTTAATYQPYTSADGVQFASFGNTFQTSNTQNAIGSFSTAPMQYVRVVTSTAGSGITINYVGFSCAG